MRFAAILFALAASTLFLAVAHAQSEIKKVALLVGVNRYEKRGFADRPLQFAERDVEEMRTELRKHGFLVGMLNSSSPGKSRATKANIEAALQTALQGLNARDVVLLGFAGHGQQMPLRDEKGEIQTALNGQPLEDAYFCPVDAEMGEAKSMISLTQLMDTLNRKGGVNLILVDACRDDPNPGRSARSISGNELNGRLPANTAIVFSCAAGQQALETKDAGGGHGVFFYHVLEGLRGEAAKRNGDITWSSLVEYVRDNTNERAKEWFPDFVSRAREGNLQTPHELRNLINVPVLARMSTAVPTPPQSLPVIPAPTKSSPVAPAPSSPRTTGRPANPMPLPRPLPRPAGVAGTKAGEERDDNGLRLKLVWCPPGEFMMGSPKSDIYALDSEKPQVKVTLSQGFWLGKFEVTQAQWQQIMGTRPWQGIDFIRSTADYAVTYVSWEDAVAFCAKLTDQEREAGRLPAGWSYTLPTEAWWEYAARAGSVTKYSFGDNASRLGEYEWYSVNAGDEEGAHQVGQKLPNNWGLHDMHGNVREWCRDFVSDKPIGGRDPEVPEDSSKNGSDSRAHRGGDWRSPAKSMRLAIRGGSPPDRRDAYLGFRLALAPSSK